MKLRLLCLGLLLPAGLWAQFPEIKSLGPQDVLFRQLQDQISLYYQLTSQNQPPTDLLFFHYKVKTGDTVFSLGARFNLPYDTLTSLNNLDRAQDLGTGRLILVPSQPGIFASADQGQGMADVMLSWRGTQSQGITLKIPRNGRLENYIFYPRARYHPVERAFFLGILFHYPLERKGRLTSSFGSRANPFTGHPSFHNGIDIGAPTGTEIYAARDGVVIASGWDDVLGQHVRIRHDDGYETVYGHMSIRLATLNQKVLSGTLIGKVGTTGLSTGPHLHFEIRRQGHPQDPVPLLPTKP